MNVKELEVTRNGEWLFLTPKINDNIINLSGLKNYNHTSSNNNISVNNIIDLRDEFNSIKKNGYIHFYFRFNDFKQNKVHIPSNIADNDNPYFIDSIYIFNINRYKQEKRKLLYCSDINNGDDKHCFKCSPIKNVFISHLANDYWTNNKIFSPRGLPNWLYIGPSMYFNYKKDLATEKTSGLNKNVSKNGWGFFFFAFRMPNTLYTPKFAQILIKVEDSEFFYYDIIHETLVSNNNVENADIISLPPSYDEIYGN